MHLECIKEVQRFFIRLFLGFFLGFFTISKNWTPPGTRDDY
jgi:hypothetical protein